MYRKAILLGLLFGIMLLGSTSVSYATVLIDENFNTTVTEFTFNGYATQDLGTGTAVLTPSTDSAAGSMYYNTAIPVDRFTAQFDFQLGTAGGYQGGADGIVFAVLAPPSVPTNLGLGGANFGWGPTNTGFAVEFDIFNNEAYGVPSEINANHVGLDVNGSITSLAVAAVNPAMKNGGWFSARVEFDQGDLDVYLANQTIGFPETHILSGTVPNFTPFTGFFGFAGGTGAGFARQEVDNFVLDRHVSVVPEPSTLLLLGSGLAGLGGLATRGRQRK